MTSLSPGEVHLWIAEIQGDTPRATADALLRLLDAAELERYRRFRFEHHALQYLVSHALLRQTLSRYASVPPEAWAFTAGAHGKPEILGGRHGRLQFNLSHTQGMAACAVTVGARIGVDVEHAQESCRSFDELARDCFSAAECQSMQGMPEPERRRRFFELWTLKEAFVKARGEGLTLPLRALSFELRAGEPPRICFSGMEDSPRAWHFFHALPTATHHLALAVKWPRARPLVIRCQRTPPVLRDDDTTVILQVGDPATSGQ